MTERTESVTTPGDAQRRLAVRAWTVEVVAGPDRGRAPAVLRGLWRVGSDAGNDLVLADPAVSRRHLELEPTPSGLLLRDLGSRNGTRVGGRVVLLAAVEPGDLVDLGATRLRLGRVSHSGEVALEPGESFGELVGASEPMALLFAELRQAAQAEAPLLLTGEPGTGKELAARAVHAHSPRRGGPFQVLDCGQRDEAALDRELLGALAEAREGTLVLDEVGELPPALQRRLLRALEAGEARPGARVLATTTRTLEEEAAQGRFRLGLLHRLAVLRVRLPPLRAHKEDLPLLARHLGRALPAPLELSPQMRALLEGYDWPGNVRELRQVLERGALLQAGGAAGWAELLVPTAGGDPGPGVLELASRLPYHQARDRVLADFERRYLAEVLRAADYQLQVAAARTGLSTQSLYRLLQKHGLRLRALRQDRR